MRNPFRVAVACACAVLVAGCRPEQPQSPGSLPAAPQVGGLRDAALSWHIPAKSESLRGLRLLVDLTQRDGAPVLATAAAIVRTNHRLGAYDALTLATVAFGIAKRERIDAVFFAATILQESGFAPDALSSAGAVGIGQFTLETAAAYGVDPFDWREALRGSAHLLHRYLQAYDGVYADRYAAALAAYNAGPGAVAHYRGVPPYPETREYVADIYERWSRILRDSGHGI